MSKTGTLSYNATSNKWEASYNGYVFLKSRSKEYIVNKVLAQDSIKVREFAITSLTEVGNVNPFSKVITDTLEPVETHEEITFGINERFKFLADFVSMVATRDINSVIITGQGGLGKSFTVMQTLTANGLSQYELPEEGADSDVEDGESFTPPVGPKEYIVVKGYSTPKGLYRTLYENRNNIIVFDDCDSILENATSTNMLKAALDSYERRVITWNSESPFGGDGLPKSFEFKGAVIFISNLMMHKMPQAVMSRSMLADVTMSRPEIVTRMRTIVDEGGFMPEVDMEFKLDALNFIERNASNPAIKAMNLRTLIGVVKARIAKPEHWERLSLYSMINGK